MGPSSRGAFAIPHLAGLQDVRGALEDADGERRMLSGLAESAARALQFSIVINLYRPAWDDFVVAVVTGDDQMADSLLGERTSWDDWREILAPRFRRGNAYFVPNGAYDFGNDFSRYTPARSYGDADDAWQTGDELFLPLHGGGDEVLAILSLDEPLSGKRPTDEVLESLEAAGAHIAMALDIAHQATIASRHRAGVEHLMRISAGLGRGTVEETLQAVCEGVRVALGMDVVGALLLDDAGQQFELRASVGLAPGEREALRAVPRSVLEPLLTAPDVAEHGWALLDPARARALGADRSAWPHRSTRNGFGAQAWRDHLLQVPLIDRDGGLRGAVWVDDPQDRLLPGRVALQALRTFANQAAAALESGRQLRALAHMAEHDPLTGLRNRRGLLEEIGCELVTGDVTLLMCDMDHFKRVNDRLGYARGDDAICRVARILAAAARSAGGTAARLGGEEFALVLPGAREPAARLVAAGIRADVQRAFADFPWAQTVSIGLATGGADRPDAGDLLRRASGALIAAKRLGRDRCVGHDEEVVGRILRGLEEAGPISEATAALVRLAETLDMREYGTGRHAQTVAELTRAVAVAMGMDDARVERLRLAGLLHDIGKVVVPASILRKPGRLDAAEWEEIRRHPLHGARLLEHAGLLDVAGWVLAHHERLDGGGYPSGLAAEDIPLEARIVAAADAYEAMRSERSYSRPLSAPEAKAEVLRCAGTQFDPAVVDALVRVVEPPVPVIAAPARLAPADRRSIARAG